MFNRLRSLRAYHSSAPTAFPFAFRPLPGISDPPRAQPAPLAPPPTSSLASKYPRPSPKPARADPLTFGNVLKSKRSKSLRAPDANKYRIRDTFSAFHPSPFSPSSNNRPRPQEHAGTPEFDSRLLDSTTRTKPKKPTAKLPKPFSVNTSSRWEQKPRNEEVEREVSSRWHKKPRNQLDSAPPSRPERKPKAQADEEILWNEIDRTEPTPLPKPKNPSSRRRPPPSSGRPPRLPANAVREIKMNPENLQAELLKQDVSEVDLKDYARLEAMAARRQALEAFNNVRKEREGAQGEPWKNAWS